MLSVRIGSSHTEYISQQGSAPGPGPGPLARPPSSGSDLVLVPCPGKALPSVRLLVGSTGPRPPFPRQMHLNLTVGNIPGYAR